MCIVFSTCNADFCLQTEMISFVGVSVYLKMIEYTFRGANSVSFMFASLLNEILKKKMLRKNSFF